MLQYFPNITGSLQVTGSVSVSGSITATGGIIVSGSIASASYSSNSELLDNLDSTAFVFTSSFNTYSSSMSTRVGKIEGNYATTGSNIFMGAQTVCANITSTGTIIAQTLNVQQVTSSVVYSSGSNVFGCSLSNTQQFTGSVFVTGSTLTVAGGNLKSGDGNVLGRTTICTTSTPQILSTRNGSVGLTITSESDTNHFGWRITNQNVIDTGFEIARSSVTGSNNTFCSPYFVIKGDGTVGINCTSPTATLTVGGTSRFGGEATFVSNITGTSACFSSQVCAPQSNFTYTGTTGNAVRINGDNLTTGTALSIVANNGSPSHTGNVVEICNAFNAGAAAKLLCLYQGDDGDGIYVNMARGGVGLTIDGVGSGYSAIFNNGNVGIGCTAPSQKLDIGSGHIKLSDGYGLFYGTQTQVYASEASKYVRFDIAGTSGVMFLSGSGRVGIGTTTPCAKLDVSYTGTETGVRLVGGAGACCGNMFRSYISDYSDTSPINLFWANHGGPARTNTLVRIHTNETSAGGYPFRVTAQGSLCSPTYEALAIDYVGNVGIGCASPQAKLDLYASSGDHMRFIGRGASDYSDTVFYATNNTTRLGYIDWSNTQSRWNVEANIPLVLYTNATERLRITACGTVKTQTSQAIGAVDQSGTIANNSSVSLNLNSAGGNGSIGFIAIGVARTDTTACQAVRLFSNSHTNGANSYTSIVGINDGGITISDCVGSGVQYIVNCSGNTVNYVVRYVNLISLNAIYERQ